MNQQTNQPTIELSAPWWEAVLEDAKKNFHRYPWESNCDFIARIAAGQAEHRSYGAAEIRARHAVSDQPRHDKESLFELIAKEYPELSQQDLEAVVAQAF